MLLIWCYRYFCDRWSEHQ